MLTATTPVPQRDQDETAISALYAEQDPTVVASELLAAAAELAGVFDA